MDRTFFFVIGAPRSGTTMLQLALNRHSQIVMPPETAYFTLLTRSRRGQRLHWKRIRRDLGIEIEPPTKRLAAGPEARDCFLQVADAYARRVGRTDAPYFGEKSPEHQRRVPLILKTFPKARFILIYRDGRDVALSLTKVPWIPRNLYLNFALWLHYCDLQKELLAEHDERVHCIKYEDLVVDPETHLRGALEFLGLPYEAAVASGSGQDRGVPDYELTYKQRAFQPIAADQIGKFRRELSSRQIAVLERWGKETLTSLGYQLETDGAGRLPLWHFPYVYARCALWLGGRAIGQWIDEWCGTALNPANRSAKMPPMGSPANSAHAHS